MDMFNVPRGISTHWASMENLDAAIGAGGKELFGRKGAACKTPFEAGECFTMAHATGMGVVRRMWVTILEREPEYMRGLVIRMYWDGEEKPAVEAPLGDFFCQPLGEAVKFENAWFDNPEGRSFNMRIPMPFKKSFKITITNETQKKCEMLFYDVNFTLGDKLEKDTCYFHAHYRRENPTTLKQDFEILPKIVGRGRYLGCNMGVISDMVEYGRFWWGEGEVKMYIDGDTDYPTICGTGTEDYIATGWGQGNYSCMWHGCNYTDHEYLRYGFYRLHGPDPVYFSEDIRITIQQIGCPDFKPLQKFLKKTGKEFIKTGDGTKVMNADNIKEEKDITLFERTDDWSATAYFYLDSPTNDLPPIDSFEKRVANLRGI